MGLFQLKMTLAFVRDRSDMQKSDNTHDSLVSSKTDPANAILLLLTK